MFSRLGASRLAARRLIHTHVSPLRPSPRKAAVLSVGALATSFLAYTYSLNNTSVHLDSPETSSSSHQDAQAQTPPPTDEQTESGEQAQSQGAYDPETGEINWDCPCLGGMAHGPCGEQFKTAFSCFVYSEEEPKGINCIEAFKAMQDCFREHPEAYADQLDNDDDNDDVQAERRSEKPDTQPNEGLSQPQHPETTSGSHPTRATAASKSSSASSF